MNDTTRRRWIAYLRVSTDEQARDGISLDAQREAICGSLLAKGERDPWIIEDPGQSARSLERPGIRQAMAAIERGEIAGIAIWKLDRLSRSLRDLLGLVDLLQRSEVEIVSLQEALDTSGPMGRFQLSLLGALAQLESEQTAMRTRAARDYLKSHGYWAGGPIPAGCRVTGPRGKRILERDPQTAPIVEQIWPALIAGQSLRQVAEWLTSQNVPSGKNGRGWSAMKVRRVVTRSDLVGILVDEPTHTRVIALLQSRQQIRPGIGKARSDAPWPLRQLARCGACGCALTGVTGGKGRQRYLRCTGRIRYGRSHCAARDLPAEPYEAATVAALQDVLRDPQRFETLAAEHRTNLASRRRELDADAAQHDQQERRTRDHLLRRIDTWLDLLADAVPAEQAAIRSKIRQASERAEELSHGITAREQQRKQLDLSEAQLATAIHHLRAGIESLHLATGEQLATLLPGLLQSVTIHASERLDLAMWLSPPDEVSSKGIEWLPTRDVLRHSVAVREHTPRGSYAKEVVLI